MENLYRIVSRRALPDEKVGYISSRVVIRLMPEDYSVILYKDNGIEIDNLTLSRDEIVALEKATRKL